jgi:CheY-like chemotaxis protein
MGSQASSCETPAVSLPRLLLVDDSQAILAYETASLSDQYGIVTANNGREALSRLAESKFDAVLLDLSMPEMDGDDVLRVILADSNLCHVPVIIVSTERARAEACVKAGAIAYLAKPIRADELRLLVGRVLETTWQKQQAGSLAVLFLSIGSIEIAVALESVRAVALFPAMKTLTVDENDSCEFFEFHGELICVLDLARLLDVAYRVPRVDRWIVILTADIPLGPDRRCFLGLCVDAVRTPEVLKTEAMHVEAPRGIPREAVLSFVRNERGPVAVTDPVRLLSSRLLEKLPNAMKRAFPSTAPPP